MARTGRSGASPIHRRAHSLVAALSADLVARLARRLFFLARRPAVHAAVRWIFAHASRLLPVRRVAETDQVLAFHHPRPHWPVHLLLVPKRAIPSLMEVGPADLDVLRDVFRLAERAAARLGPAERGYTLLVNGGAYQHVGQLHFHLVAGAEELSYRCPPFDAAMPGPAPSVEVSPHPFPRRATHLVLRLNAPVADLTELADAFPALVESLLATTQSLVRGNERLEAGLTLLVNLRAGAKRRPLCFHLVSGARLPG